jgi:hypothetical protein
MNPLPKGYNGQRVVHEGVGIECGVIECQGVTISKFEGKQFYFMCHEKDSYYDERYARDIGVFAYWMPSYEDFRPIRDFGEWFANRIAFAYKKTLQKKKSQAQVMEAISV